MNGRFGEAENLHRLDASTRLQGDRAGRPLPARGSRDQRRPPPGGRERPPHETGGALLRGAGRPRRSRRRRPHRYRVAPSGHRNHAPFRTDFHPGTPLAATFVRAAGASLPRRRGPARLSRRDLREARERLAEASRPLAEERGTYGELPERGALPALEDLRVIGQLAAGYILVEEPDEALWVVDQHVAHERAILDRLHDSDSPATMQSLLVPEVVELSPSEAEIAAASLDELSVYGFEESLRTEIYPRDGGISTWRTETSRAPRTPSRP